MAGKGKTSHTFVDDAGNLLDLGKINKLFKDVLRQHHGTITDGPLAPRPVTPVNVADPIGQIPLEPSEESPICRKCDLWTAECNNPFMPYFGSKNPLVTVVFDSVSPTEDKHGYITAGGAAHTLKTIIDMVSSETGVTSDDCRFIALTRCAHRSRTPPNYKGKGNFCKIFAVQDLMEHPPKVIMPVGTTALGLFCHKSNAQEWGGRELTWRGWPDDWLTDSDYVYEREIDVNGEKQKIVGHPLFGPPPGLEKRCILFPIQAPRLIAATRNRVIEDAWGNQIVAGLRLATQGISTKTYDLPHYRLIEDANEVISELQWLIEHPGTLVCYDTETEGLYPFQGQKVVFMMFRFVRDGEPVAIGFPWDYAEDLRGPASSLLGHLEMLRPYVADALCASVLVGHNLVFDILFSHCNLTDIVAARPLDDRGQIREEWREAMRRLNALSEASGYDTWHMAYTRRQQRGSLGLEAIAYDYVPELAGYEEEMTLLIELDKERLHPEKGGHYARCQKELWDSHLKPYVLGDVEVCYRAREALQVKLNNARRYSIPIAHNARRGFFRYVGVPDRAWLYEKIMAPANRVLTKMMGRGMCIDQKALDRLELEMPAAITDAIEKMRNTKEHGVVWQYCQEMAVRDPLRLDPNEAKRWQLDLESKDQLRDILFKRMKLDIQRLTKTGRKLYGEEAERWESHIEAALTSANPDLLGTGLGAKVREELLKYAALDKFTLNKLSVDYPEVRPLQDYRKIHKLYTTYVRPLRNITIEGIDKKVREQVPHLCPDGMIHAQFLLTGTRGGRLSSRCLPLDTPVATQNGLVALATVQPGDLIQSAYGPTKVLAVERTGLRPVLRFSVETGRVLKCSPDHLIFVNGAWIRASQAKVGDSMYLCGVSGPDSAALPLPDTAWCPAQNCKERTQITLPGAMSDDLAFLLGHYIAEGCVGYNRARRSTNIGLGGNQHGSYAAKRAYTRRYADGEKIPVKVIVAFGWNERDLAAHVERLYAKLFNVSGCTNWGLKSPALILSSGALACWLLEIGCGGYSTEKRIPPRILSGPLTVARSFLRGLFEGDGGVAVRTAALATDSEGLADDVTLLLSRLGILASHTKTKRSSGVWKHRVAVLAGSREAGRNLFWSFRKTSAVKPSIEAPAVALLPGMRVGRLANESSAEAVFRSKLNAGQAKVLTKQRLEKLRGAWLEPKWEVFTDWALRANAVSVKIESVEVQSDVEMGDIETEAGSFLVNGIQVHNSPNLQQLPKEGYATDGHRSALNVKEMYVSRFGKRGCLYGSDFSQIELRLLAALSGDRTMVEAYFNDIDLHTLTTSKIFKLDYDVFSKGHMKKLEEAGRDKEAKELKLKRDIGKCVDPATLISVNGNVMRIGQLSPGRKADTFYPITGCRVQTPTGTAVINNFYSNGSARRVLMVSRKGVIACGLNHRFALKDGSLARAEDLKKGDILADAVGLESCGRANEVLFDPFSLGVTCENSPFRVVVTGALAYAIGLFSGDGTVNSNYIAITTGGGEPYRLWQDIVAVALKSAGFEPSVTRSEKRSDGSQSGKVTFGSCRVIDVFEQLGLVTPDKKRALRVPSFILNGSEETKVQFLAGLFDTDGSCERQGMLSVTTKSWELLQDVSAIIRGIGMAFSLEPRWNEAYQKWYFRLNLSVRHSWKFFRRYLRHPKKRAGLHKPAFEYTKEWPNQVLQVIPLDDGPVVDIEIDSCDRLYISNCLSTHNTVNFLTGYGGGAFGLQTILAAKQQYKPIEFCEEIIASFFSTYPAVRDLLGYYKRFIQANEVAVSMFGRVRVFEEVSSHDPEIASKALRAGCNHLIQSTASDMMLICLSVIEDMMREANLDSILMLTVHDSLVVDAVRDELPAIHEIVDLVLNNMPEVFKMILGEDYDTSWMIVPFAGDSEIGLDYANMKGIPRDCSKLDWDKVLSNRS